MKKALKRQWIAALRSGEYEQTRDKLHDAEGFCCLGVACDLFVDDWWEWDSADEYYYLSKGGDSMVLPNKCNEAWGLSLTEEIFLRDMNDNGSTFAEIADWIEANIPGE